MNLREQNELICTCICRQTELYCEWAKRCGMSYNTMMTLYALHLEPGITQKAITQGWLLPKQTVNTVVKELQRQGYVRLEAGKAAQAVVTGQLAFTAAFEREVHRGT